MGNCPDTDIDPTTLYKTIGFYVSHAFMGKFVEHKRIVRVARGLVESKSSFLSDTC